MLKHILIILALALTQAGCSIEEGGGAYNPVPLTDNTRQELEGLKREFLSINDLKLGTGPLAAWGRKISADIDVRYADGTVAYHGPMFIYSGFSGSVFIQEAIKESGKYNRKVCSEYASDLFNSDVMAKKYLYFYEQVLNGEMLNQTKPQLKSVQTVRFLPWLD